MAADLYERIYFLVRSIPPGRVTTYGQLGSLCGIGDSRIVGEAMNASEGLPWQRVINSRGEVSIRGATGARQRELLEQEGVEFDAAGRVDLEKYGWEPEAEFLRANGYMPPPPLVKQKKRKEGEQPSLF